MKTLLKTLSIELADELALADADEVIDVELSVELLIEAVLEVAVDVEETSKADDEVIAGAAHALEMQARAMNVGESDFMLTRALMHKLRT